MTALPREEVAARLTRIAEAAWRGQSLAQTQRRLTRLAALAEPDVASVLAEGRLQRGQSLTARAALLSGLAERLAR